MNKKRSNETKGGGKPKVHAVTPRLAVKQRNTIKVKTPVYQPALLKPSDMAGDTRMRRRLHAEADATHKRRQRVIDLCLAGALGTIAGALAIRFANEYVVFAALLVLLVLAFAQVRER